MSIPSPEIFFRFRTSKWRLVVPSGCYFYRATACSHNNNAFELGKLAAACMSTSKYRMRKSWTLQQITNKKLSYRWDSARDADDVNFKPSKSLKVIHCYANRCDIYDVLLALNNNLTSIFNHSLDITPSLHIHTPPLFQVELEKTAESRRTCFGV